MGDFKVPPQGSIHGGGDVTDTFADSFTDIRKVVRKIVRKVYAHRGLGGGEVVPFKDTPHIERNMWNIFRLNFAQCTFCEVGL